MPHHALTGRQSLSVGLDERYASTTGARRGRLTHNREDESDTYHSDVEQIPNIRRIEDGSSIAPLTQLVVKEGREPYVEEDLGQTDLCRITFHKHRIVKEEERHEENNLKGLEVSGDT